MTETPKCPKGCDAEQVAGESGFAMRRTPTIRTPQGALVLGRYTRVRLRQHTCSACGKVYEVDEVPPKVAIKRPTGTNRKQGKRGKKPKTRKRSTAN